MEQELAERIQGLVRPILEGMELILVELKVRRHRDIFIEVFADRPLGGITLEECSEVNRRLKSQLDAAKITTADYIVEVSSPGLDRPLQNRQDFLRVLNRSVHFFLSSPVHNQWEQEGIIRQVDEQNVVIRSREEDIVIPLGQITKAVQVITD